jgi:hypothetical protein
LIELLTVIALLAALIAMTRPAIGKGRLIAQRQRCAVNQRSISQALFAFASDSFGAFPSYKLPGVPRWGDAYGLRDDLHPYDGPTAGPRPAFNVGLAVEAGYLPVRSLPGILHCPSFNNNSTALGASAGHGMDSVAPSWKGGSSWDALPNWRILSTYNYRAPSYQRNNDDKPPRLQNADSSFVLLIDTPDVRFRGWRSAYNAHGGYNTVTSDMSARFYADPTFEIDAIVAIYQARGERGTVDGRGGGGGWGNGKLDEEIYALLAKSL